MTPTATAKAWLAADADYRDAKRRRDEAADVLKAHFRAKKVSVFRGVAYAVTHGRRLDAAKARALLGPKASEAEVPTTTETLSAVPK
jgi:hypothetical protein